MADIDSEVRENLGIILKWYLKDDVAEKKYNDRCVTKLDKFIETELANVEEEASVGAMSFDGIGKGKGGVPGSSVERKAVNENNKSKFFLKVFKELKNKKLDPYFNLLSTDQRNILKWFYGSEKTLDMIGHKLHVSGSRVAQRKKKILNVLAKRMNLDRELNKKAFEVVSESVKELDRA